jgi:hypothetical protein
MVSPVFDAADRWRSLAKKLPDRWAISVQQVHKFARYCAADFFQFAAGFVSHLAVLEPAATVLVDRLQGEQGVPARQGVAMLAGVIGIV